MATSQPVTGRLWSKLDTSQFPFDLSDLKCQWSLLYFVFLYFDPGEFQYLLSMATSYTVSGGLWSHEVVRSWFSLIFCARHVVCESLMSLFWHLTYVSVLCHFYQSLQCKIFQHIIIQNELIFCDLNWCNTWSVPLDLWYLSQSYGLFYLWSLPIVLVICFSLVPSPFCLFMLWIGHRKWIFLLWR